MGESRAVNILVESLVASTEAAEEGRKPFRRLAFDRVFPGDLYERMLAAMPVVSDYRPMSGRTRADTLVDGGMQANGIGHFCAP